MTRYLTVLPQKYPFVLMFCQVLTWKMFNTIVTKVLKNKLIKYRKESRKTPPKPKVRYTNSFLIALNLTTINWKGVSGSGIGEGGIFCCYYLPSTDWITRHRSHCWVGPVQYLSFSPFFSLCLHPEAWWTLSGYPLVCLCNADKGKETWLVDFY